MKQFLSELSRRNIFRVAAAYVIVGWIVLQVASIVAPAMGLPGTAVSFVLFAILMGFPLVIFVTWAFEMTPEGVKRTDASAQAPTSDRRMDMGLIAAALILAATGLVAPARTVVVDEAASTGIEKEDGIVPSFTLAVLPFENFSDDKQLGWIADGISEDILTNLSYVPRLQLAARNSSFQFKGQNLDIREIGNQLNVRYVLEGSLRKQGDALRITAQLIETETGNHVWANQFNPALSDIATLHDDVIGDMVTDVASIITKLEYDRITSLPIDELTPGDLVNATGVSIIRANFSVARQYADLAVKNAPNNSAAHAYRAMSLTMPTVPGGVVVITDEIRQAFEEEVTAALTAPGVEVQTYLALAAALNSTGDWERGRQYSDLAVEMGPNYPGSHLVKSASELALGHYAASLTAAKNCSTHTHRKDPLFDGCLIRRALAENALKDFDATLISIGRVSSQTRNIPLQIEKLIALVGNNQIPEASQVYVLIEATAPQVPPLDKMEVLYRRMFSDRDYIDFRLNAMRQAGWKEGAED